MGSIDYEDASSPLVAAQFQAQVESFRSMDAFMTLVSIARWAAHVLENPGSMIEAAVVSKLNADVQRSVMPWCWQAWQLLSSVLGANSVEFNASVPWQVDYGFAYVPMKELSADVEVMHRGD